jgi:hypothetical protein
VASNTYPLDTVVSFLEAALSASGCALPDVATSSRKGLKKRLRKLRQGAVREKPASQAATC